jgi:hypothetical protein
MNFSENNRTEEIDPIVYLNKRRKDIIHNFVKVGLAEPKATNDFEWLISFLRELAPLRLCQSETDEFLNKNENQYCYVGRFHLLTHLIDATQNSLCYGYAFNTFVYYGNLYLSLNLKRRKFNRIELLQAVQDEAEAEYYPKSTPQLSLSQVALQYVWEGRVINLQNCNQIAGNHGYSSGNALYNRYCTFSSAAFRKATSDLTKKQLKNKIRLFESVMNLLPEKRKHIALQEITILQNALEDF